jgi:hypothetical protein
MRAPARGRPTPLPFLTDQYVRVDMIAAGLIAGALVVGLALGDEYGRVWRLALEVPIWAVMAILIARAEALRSLLRDLGPWRTALVAGVPFLMVVGQVMNNQNRSYPFPPWAMYSETMPSDSFTEYELELASGRRLQFPFDQLAPRFARSFKDRFNADIEMAAFPGDRADVNARAAALVERDLDRLIALYERRFDGDRVRSLRVMRVTVPIRSYAGPASLVRRELARRDRS